MQYLVQIKMFCSSRTVGFIHFMRAQSVIAFLSSVRTLWNRYLLLGICSCKIFLISTFI